MYTLDPDSRFFKQLQDLLVPDPSEAPKLPLPSFLIPRNLVESSILDLQDVIDSSTTSRTTVEVERSTSPAPQISAAGVGVHLSDIFGLLYPPSGKWEWMLGRNIIDEDSMFLSAGAMCSTFYRKGRAGARKLSYISKSWKTNMHWNNSFYSELALYKKQLKPLQGKCVPSIIGVYTGPATLDVAMDPPHSSFWIEASTDMPLSLKNRCIAAFTEIHSRGVFHGDVELRHMLIGGDAKVTIIDFQESTALESNEKVFLSSASEADLRKEMRKVNVKLDYPGSRAYEREKRDRCLKRNRHNADELRKTVLNPRHVPQIEKESEDDILNSPVLDAQEWADWIAVPELPRLFVVPGQSLQQRTAAYEAFLASLEVPSQVPGDSLSPSDNKPDKGPPASPIIPTDQPTSSPDFLPPPFTSVIREAGPPPLKELGLAVRRRNKRRVRYPNLATSFPQISDRTSASSSSQTHGPEVELIGAQTDKLALKRRVSHEPQSSDTRNRLIKRARLGDHVSESAPASFVVPHVETPSDVLPPSDVSTSSQNDGNLKKLGKHEGVLNLRYPSKRKLDQSGRPKAVMKSKLYPQLPRWAEPDVQVLLTRLQETDEEEEVVGSDIRNPPHKATLAGAQYPKSPGGLKRALDDTEARSDSQSLTEEELIRGWKRPRYERKVSVDDEGDNRALSKICSSPLHCDRKTSTPDTGAKSLPHTWHSESLAKIPQSQLWIQRFVTRVLSWI